MLVNTLLETVGYFLYRLNKMSNDKVIADSYETSIKRISENYIFYREQYIEEKHYYYLQGEELKGFLQYGNYGTQN